MLKKLLLLLGRALRDFLSTSFLWVLVGRLLLQFCCFLVHQNLATGVVNIKVHFVADRELLKQFPQLLQRVEKHDTASSVEVIRLD